MESKFSLTRLTLVFLWATLSAWLGAAPREVVLLYTNDFHSAVDPIPAYWMKGTPHLGGAAQLSTLINRIRAREKTVFLFDTGDMFTGMLSFLTRGEALMEMMAAFRYDAMAIGNHEFDYGASNFEKQMYRVSFPILGANIYYKSTRHSYARPSTIVRRNGVRVGVVGVIGKDARSVALPSGITELEFTDPVQEVSRWVSELRDQVDLMVVLTHQGKSDWRPEDLCPFFPPVLPSSLPSLFPKERLFSDRVSCGKIALVVSAPTTSEIRRLGVVRGNRSP
ncbi:MAG: metallophosphoesterase [Acidobacteriota bacterium]